MSRTVAPSFARPKSSCAISLLVVGFSGLCVWAFYWSRDLSDSSGPDSVATGPGGLNPGRIYNSIIERMFRKLLPSAAAGISASSLRFSSRGTRARIPIFLLPLILD